MAPFRSILFLSFVILIVSPFGFAGNVIVRNGQLNVSAGIYGDSDTFYLDSENDRVGIGTTSPGSKLTISGGTLEFEGDGVGGLEIKQTGSGALNIYNTVYDDLHLGTNGTVRMTVDQDGNVGIGMESPIYPLQVVESGVTGEASSIFTGDLAGRVISIQGDGAAYFVGRDVTNDIEFAMGISGLGYAFSGAMSDHDLALRTGNNNRVYIEENASNSDEYVRIDGSGNVGIGTDSPGARLEVTMNSFVSAGNQSQYVPVVFTTRNNKHTFTIKRPSIHEDRNWLAYGFVQVTAIGYGWGSQGHSVSAIVSTFGMENSDNSGDMIPFVGRIRADWAGTYNVIVWLRGNTTYHTDGIVLYNNGSYTDSASNSFGTVDWGTEGYGLSKGQYFALLDISSNSSNYESDYSFDGNVGIGTTSPAKPLHINQSSAGALRLSRDGYSNYFDIYESKDGSNNELLYFQSDGGLSMVLRADGNVGIGTTSATGLLTVHSVNGGSEEIFFSNQDGSNQNSNSSRINFVGQAQTAGFGIQAINVVPFSYGRKDLVFYSHNADDYTTYGEVLRIRYNGKVGIGTTSPSGKLQIDHDSSSASPQLVLRETASGDYARLEFNDNGTVAWHIAAKSGRMNFWDGGGDVMMIEGTNNRVGIGTTSPELKLDVEGDIEIGTGTTGCVRDSDNTTIAGTCSSDIRLKQDIESLDGVLDNVSLLKPVRFKWIGGNVTEYGLIAQEVREVMPELVSEDDDGYLRVSYDSKLFMLMLESIRELEMENDNLSAENRKRQEEIETLQAVNAGLEERLSVLEEKLGNFTGP